MRKFTEILEEYLDEQERQNSNYYDDRYLGAKIEGRLKLEDLADELQELCDSQARLIAELENVTVKAIDCSSYNKSMASNYIRRNTAHE